MRIVTVRPDREAQDIAEGRELLRVEVRNPATTVMIIRGSGPAIAALADKVAGRESAVPTRRALWIQSKEIFPDQEGDPLSVETLFDGHDTSAAVALDLQDRPVRWLDASASTHRVELAFADAEAME